MSEIKYTELDFALIKDNLKTFLKSQDKFKDYNFDGSSLSILLDILAYNTGYNAFYLNMLASEMFLDSASLRESVVSRAKHLGYVPKSTRSIRAKIDYTVKFSLDTLPNIPTGFSLSKNQEFYTNFQNSRYTFYPLDDVLFERLPNEGTGPNERIVFIARDVELVEGKRFTHSYIVNNNSITTQKYIIPNSGCDISTLKVYVKDNSSSTNITVFLSNNDITLLNSSFPAYFIQPYESDLYEIVFGDGILGKSVVNGNVIFIDYVVSTGPDASGSSVFTTGSIDISGGSQSFNIVTKSVASGYSEQESISSIKLLAPRAYEAQNRAVTKYDYETLILKDVPLVDKVRVWGGEDNIPPEYGKVYCAIQPKTGIALNQEDKHAILETYIRPRNMISTEVVIVEPEYIGITVNSTVNYDSNKTTLSPDGLKAVVLTAISSYKSQNLSGFDSDFRFSKFVNYIDSANDSIVSNVTEIGMKYKLYPVLDSKNSFTITLNSNEIDKGDYINSVSSITSSKFYYNNSIVSISDDGQGQLFLYYISSDSKIVIVDSNIGTVSYETGIISINNMLVTSILNNLNYISLFVKPRYTDIIALRNQVILIEDSDVNIAVTDVSKLRLS
ncbi:baseplate wedge subunit [uncultured Caudovirales phage]|uniref:Baseplate wedge subunit n=1 Tax=uncultured Caudovirales phage TaxID=2100421 RepID=A0A6J5M8C2_9CAUD|nr:baseplate wedge subunit [uncultured Caudovirales phage]